MMVCDGCNVRQPWEHRCHGEPCLCKECREERRLFDRPRCPVHHMPHTADTWMAACRCPSTAHGIEEAD